MTRSEHTDRALDPEEVDLTLYKDALKLLSVERRTIDPLTDEAYARVIDHLIAKFRSEGTIRGGGRYASWSTTIRGLVDRRISAKFSWSADETTIRLDEDLRNLGISVSVAGTLAGGALVMLLTSVGPLYQHVTTLWAGIPLTLAGMGLGFSFAKEVVSSIYEKRKKELSGLADQLINLVGNTT